MKSVVNDKESDIIAAFRTSYVTVVTSLVICLGVAWHWNDAKRPIIVYCKCDNTVNQSPLIFLDSYQK